jgi:hypothetical protein
MDLSGSHYGNLPCLGFDLARRDRIPGSLRDHVSQLTPPGRRERAIGMGCSVLQHSGQRLFRGYKSGRVHVGGNPNLDRLSTRQRSNASGRRKNRNSLRYSVVGTIFFLAVVSLAFLKAHYRPNIDHARIPYEHRHPETAYAAPRWSLAFI